MGLGISQNAPYTRGLHEQFVVKLVKPANPLGSPFRDSSPGHGQRMPSRGLDEIEPPTSSGIVSPLVR
jgi:hypothetical protein